jgi:hypothetical protein
MNETGLKKLIVKNDFHITDTIEVLLHRYTQGKRLKTKVGVFLSPKRRLFIIGVSRKTLEVFPFLIESKQSESSHNNPRFASRRHHVTWP